MRVTFFYNNYYDNDDNYLTKTEHSNAYKLFKKGCLQKSYAYLSKKDRLYSYIHV